MSALNLSANPYSIGVSEQISPGACPGKGANPGVNFIER